MERLRQLTRAGDLDAASELLRHALRRDDEETLRWILTLRCEDAPPVLFAQALEGLPRREHGVWLARRVQTLSNDAALRSLLALGLSQRVALSWCCGSEERGGEALLEVLTPEVELALRCADRSLQIAPDWYERALGVCALDCAERTVEVYERVFEGDRRVREAVGVVEGPATLKDRVKASLDASNAAAQAKGHEEAESAAFAAAWVARRSALREGARGLETWHRSRCTAALRAARLAARAITSEATSQGEWFRERWLAALLKTAPQGDSS